MRIQDTSPLKHKSPKRQLGIENLKKNKIFLNFLNTEYFLKLKPDHNLIHGEFKFIKEYNLFEVEYEKGIFKKALKSFIIQVLISEKNKIYSLHTTKVNVLSEYPKIKIEPYAKTQVFTMIPFYDSNYFSGTVFGKVKHLIYR